jgi:hypothetical protein
LNCILLSRLFYLFLKPLKKFSVMSNKIEISKKYIQDLQIIQKLINLSSGFMELELGKKIVFIIEEQRKEFIALLKGNEIPYRFV